MEAVEGEEVTAAAERKFRGFSIESDTEMIEQGKKPGQGTSLGRLYDRKHEMRRLIVMGLNNAEIAKIMGCTAHTVCVERNSTMAQRELDTLRQQRDAEACDINSMVVKVTPRAFRLMEEAMNGEVEGERVPLKERLQMAKHLASIGGCSPVSKREVDIHQGVDRDTLSFIKDLASQRALPGDVVSPVSPSENDIVMEAEVVESGLEALRSGERDDHNQL